MESSKLIAILMEKGYSEKEATKAIVSSNGLRAMCYHYYSTGDTVELGPAGFNKNPEVLASKFNKVLAAHNMQGKANEFLNCMDARLLELCLMFPAR